MVIVLCSKAKQNGDHVVSNDVVFPPGIEPGSTP